MDPLRLLTVDDEVHVHDGLDALVDWAELGYEHTWRAHNGTEALEIARARHPDVILTDIKMPGMNGIDLIREIRGIPEYSPAIVVMSGYSEFEYAQAALKYRVADYILKPIDEAELADRLKDIRSRREKDAQEVPGAVDRDAAISAVFRRLVLTPPDARLESAAARLLPDGCTPPFSFGLLIPFGDGSPSGPDTHPWLSPEEAGAAIAATKAKATSEWVYQEAGGQVGLLISCSPSGATAQEADLWTRGLYRSISQHVPFPVMLVVGPPVEALRKIRDSRESISAYLSEHYSMAKPRYVVVSGEERPAGGALDQEQVGTLVSAVERGARLEIDRTVRAVVDSLQNTDISAVSIREWMYALILQIGRLMSALKGEVPPSLDALNRTVARVEHAPLAEVEHVLRTFVHQVTDRVTDLRSNLRHGNVILARRIVERRFAEDLTLIEVAREFGMNPIYLGQVFRDVTGMGFREYLRRCRIQEACRLLRETDMKVADVCAQVGYQTYDYFVGQFKREKGMTPSEYRRS